MAENLGGFDQVMKFSPVSWWLGSRCCRGPAPASCGYQAGPARAPRRSLSWRQELQCASLVFQTVFLCELMVARVTEASGSLAPTQRWEQMLAGSWGAGRAARSGAASSQHHGSRRGQFAWLHWLRESRFRARSLVLPFFCCNLVFLSHPTGVPQPSA